MIKKFSSPKMQNRLVQWRWQFPELWTSNRG